MKILAHRGYWNDVTPKNSVKSIASALDHEYGVESDVRDFQGELIISHDIANGNCPKLDHILKLFELHQDQLCFAINIKADGMAKLLSEYLNSRHITNYFTFDMSVPQMLEYEHENLKFFTRQSEIEQEPVLYEKAAGVWIDSFYSDQWITEKLLNDHIENGKEVCIVSPDLHGRNHLIFWDKLKSFSIDFNKLLLCTDLPDGAKYIFDHYLG